MLVTNIALETATISVRVTSLIMLIRTEVKQITRSKIDIKRIETTLIETNLTITIVIRIEIDLMKIDLMKDNVMKFNLMKINPIGIKLMDDNLMDINLLLYAHGLVNRVWSCEGGRTFISIFSVVIEV